MKQFCGNCEKVSEFREKEIEIPLGRERFRTRAPTCVNCGSSEITQKIRGKMDKWGEKIGKKFIDYQPRLAEVTVECLGQLEAKYSIPRSAMIRCFTISYLTKLVHLPNYKKAKDYLDQHEATKLLEGGMKEPQSVSVSYSLYKTITTTSSAWKMTPAGVLEEATLFCLAILKHDDIEELREIAKRIEGDIQFYKLVA